MLLGILPIENHSIDLIFSLRKSRFKSYDILNECYIVIEERDFEDDTCIGNERRARNRIECRIREISFCAFSVIFSANKDKKKRKRKEERGKEN